LAVGRGARNLGGPPSDASVSITSSPDRAAPVVLRIRDGAPLDVSVSLIVLLGWCSGHKSRRETPPPHWVRAPNFPPVSCVPPTIAPEERLRGVNPELAIVTLREALQQRLDDLADEAVELIVAEVPAYRNADDRLRSDVREHVMSHLRASLESLGSDRDVTPEDLLFVRPHAARRANRVPVADFVRAFYVGERVLWDAALSLADDEQSRQAALAFASHLPRYFEVATTHAAEVYVEAQEQLAATGERIRRDL